MIDIHDHAASTLHRRNQRFDKRAIINLALFLPNHCRECFASILSKSGLAMDDGQPKRPTPSHHRILCLVTSGEDRGNCIHFTENRHNAYVHIHLAPALICLLTQGMVIPEGLEPPTYRLGICRSILMSYGTTNLLCPNL